MSYYGHPKAPKGGIGSALGKIGGALVGLATGGPIGAIKGHIAGGKIANAILPKPAPVQQPVVVPTAQQLIPAPFSSIPIAKPINAIASALGYGQQKGGGTVAMVNGQCPVGYHPNKQASAKGPARSYCVRNRSMNPANGRAIGRAATRIKKGAAQYAKVLRVLGKRTGKMVPRSRRRK